VTLSILAIILLFCSGHHRPLPSFPTRRSSDLSATGHTGSRGTCAGSPSDRPMCGLWSGTWCSGYGQFPIPFVPGLTARGRLSARSEEHTSELQSLRHLVCRLLLEKKKKHLHII